MARGNRGDEVLEVLNFIERLQASFYGMTKEDIRDEMGWENRKIERVIKMLREWKDYDFIKKEIIEGDNTWNRNNKFPTTRKVRFKIDDTPNVLSLQNRFTNEELAALKSAVKRLSKDKTLSEYLLTLSNKLDYYMKQKQSTDTSKAGAIMEASGVASSPGPHVKINIDLLETMQQAIYGNRQIKIQYDSRHSGKIRNEPIEPLGFLYGPVNNYLIAYNRRTPDDKTRTYRFDRIKSVEIINKPVEDEGFDIKKYAQQSFGVFQESGDVQNIKWRVSKNVAKDAKNFVFHPTQKITENKDGTLTITFKAKGLREMARHLFTWDGEITPVAPAQLVDLYKELLTKSLNGLK